MRRSMEALADLREAIDAGEDFSILTAHAENLTEIIPGEIARAHAEGMRDAAQEFEKHQRGE